MSDIEYPIKSSLYINEDKIIKRICIYIYTVYIYLNAYYFIVFPI